MERREFNCHSQKSIRAGKIEACKRILLRLACPRRGKVLTGRKAGGIYLQPEGLTGGRFATAFQESNLYALTAAGKCTDGRVYGGQAVKRWRKRLGRRYQGEACPEGESRS